MFRYSSDVGYHECFSFADIPWCGVWRPGFGDRDLEKVGNALVLSMMFQRKRLAEVVVVNEVEYVSRRSYLYLVVCCRIRSELHDG